MGMLMRGLWVCVWAAACLRACASPGVPAAAGGGGSLRGALEALQRRQRARLDPGPASSLRLPSYDMVSPDYALDPEYVDDLEDLNTKYIIKVLDEDERPPETYEYKIVKKKTSASTADGSAATTKESAFRERSRHSDNDRLRNLFMDENGPEATDEESREAAENDAEYALLLGRLWARYKNRRRPDREPAPELVTLYKERNVKKRLPDNWGPVAFKRKRSQRSPVDDLNNDSVDLEEYLGENGEKIDDVRSPDDGPSDITEEYTIAFRPLEDEGLDDFSDESQYPSDEVEKRFPVTKRSSGSFERGRNVPNKSFVRDGDAREALKRFRSSSGTDPRTAKDLSEIFGNPNEVAKAPVKRNSESEDVPHETKPPRVTIETHEHGREEHEADHAHEDESHELHSPKIHHPGTSGKEEEAVPRTDTRDPVTVKKKSIDWSDYFGIDKRRKKSAGTKDGLQKQYFNTFNKEVISPMNAFRKRSAIKKSNIDSAKPSEETDVRIDTARDIAIQNTEKREASRGSGSKLDDIDRKLKNMEGYVVDEALRLSETGDELDTKEEREIKEKMVSRLAAAYSLEKMRKALKEFKQSLQTQKNRADFEPSADSLEEAKSKRIAVKKEKADINVNDISAMTDTRNMDPPSGDFEEEREVRMYANDDDEQHYSEGNMGRGSGQARGDSESSCGARAQAACSSVVRGGRARLLLPLCTLHHLCYICGSGPAGACDLFFSSEAAVVCGGEAGCERAARASLRALRALRLRRPDDCAHACRD